MQRWKRGSTPAGTTAIFWGFEYGFWLAFGTARMRYLGGVIGLVIGYVTKYHLDKHFVFNAGIAAPRTKLRRNSPLRKDAEPPGLAPARHEKDSTT